MVKKFGFALTKDETMHLLQWMQKCYVQTSWSAILSPPFSKPIEIWIQDSRKKTYVLTTRP